MPIPHPELIKLFDFLDSDTPATINWVQRYLTKHGISISHYTYQGAVKQYIAEQFIPLQPTHADITLFAQRMGNAWRIRKHRQKKDVVSLSVSLDKSVANKLSRMSKEQKKADVVSMLIKENFQEFVAEKNRQKAKRTEEKRTLTMQPDQASLMQPLNQPPSETTQVLNQSNRAEEFREAMIHLYDIIFCANEKGEPIDDQTLIQATKIYYTAFNK